MSGYLLIEIRKGFYLDSVALMRLSREIAAMDGITEAALMMGSPSNIAILRDAGLLSEEVSATGNDLVLALRARTESAGRQALDAARQALDAPDLLVGHHRRRGGAGAAAGAPAIRVAAAQRLALGTAAVHLEAVADVRALERTPDWARPLVEAGASLNR